ncbi:unnamed protein product [Nippostrongylus brasiliensis]|uniref:Glutathione S-transferase n=1 Tax=Nippostrongylus brasiliensis TaxID=27835 RepID=A0A0N4XGM1_NIPBR|nr:unnamed protein product [Nippostrongylus brasiliensis]
MKCLMKNAPRTPVFQLFALAGQEYEDVRYSFEEWAEHKDKTPFGHVPVLEVDGKQLCQSRAIARYLARQFGYAGKNAFDEAVADSIADQYADFMAEARPFIRVSVGYEKGDAVAEVSKANGRLEGYAPPVTQAMETLAKEVFLPACRKFLTLMTNFLKNNKSGFLVGDSLTWADLYLANFADLLPKVPTLYDGFPEAKAHAEMVRAIPALKKWIETRPKTDL